MRRTTVVRRAVLAACSMIGASIATVSAGATTRFDAYVAAVNADLQRYTDEANDFFTGLPNFDDAKTIRVCERLGSDSEALAKLPRPKSFARSKWQHVQNAAHNFDRAAAACEVADVTNGFEVETADQFIRPGLDEWNKTGLGT